MTDDDLRSRLRQLEGEVRDLATSHATLAAVESRDAGGTKEHLQALRGGLDRVGDTIQGLVGKWEVDHRRHQELFLEQERRIAHLEGDVEALQGQAQDAASDRQTLWRELRDAVATIHARISTVAGRARDQVDASWDRSQKWLRDWLPYITMGIVTLAFGAYLGFRG